jgi:hypothetical protein
MRWLARLACVCILIGGAETFYWRMLTPQRRSFGAWVTQLPYQKTPGILAFMTGVRAHTRNGDRIAIVLPFTHWQGGYAYAFTRSTYLLAGRTTIPLVGEDDRPLSADGAEYFACWHIAPPPGSVVIWRDANGVLSGAPRRTR